MLPARKFDFDTAVGAIGSNERKWNCDDVVLMFERPSEADSDAVDTFLEFFEPPFGKLIYCVCIATMRITITMTMMISLLCTIVLNSLDLSNLYINHLSHFTFSPSLIIVIITYFLPPPPPNDIPIYDKLNRQSMEATAIKTEIFSNCYNIF
jgi:hypothetical protein